MLRDSVYFTTLKSLDYNVVMTFTFNNDIYIIIDYDGQTIFGEMSKERYGDKA